MPTTTSALCWRRPWPGEPQKVTRCGRWVGVVVSAEEYERLRQLDQANAPTLSELLLALPQGDQAFEPMGLTPQQFRCT